MAQLRLGFAVGAAACLAGWAAGCPALADERKAEVVGVEDRDLRQALERYIGESRGPPQSRFEARRRAEDAAESVIVVLRSEGYYAYTVTPEVTEGDNPKPIVRVDPGRRFVFSRADVGWANQPPSEKAQQDARAAVQLEPGSPGRAADVVAAEGRIIAALLGDGYADASAQTREVIVDHADLSVQPSFRIDAGALARLDGVQVSTRGRTNPQWVAYLAPWKSGDAYAPEPVGELERRLLDTGVYNSVTVALSPQANPDGLRPVIVSLADRPKGTVALSASYSTYEGAGVTGRYTLYNRLGRADTMSFSGQYGSRMKRVDAELSLPHWKKPQRTLRLGATAYRDDTDAYVENDIGVRADLETRLSKTSFRTIGISADYTRNNEKSLVLGEIIGVRRDLALLTGLGRLSLDRSNNPLDPTQGWKLDGRVEPTLGAGDDTLAYLKAQAQVSAYLPLERDGGTVLAGRLRLGSILSTGGTVYVPAARRFYAGGGGSVRGYAYQAVGPRFPDNTPIGGQSLAEASLEARKRITDKLGAVVFVDAGTVSAEKYPDFKSFSAGAGVGVSYNLGFAPFRLDVAVPLNRREGDGAFQVYISIGQSF